MSFDAGHALADRTQETRLQSLEAAKGGRVEFKKLGVIPDAMALAVDQARESVEYLFDNVGNVVQATRSAVATTTDTLRHLIDSGKLQCNSSAFSPYVSRIKDAMFSSDYKGGAVAIESMRLRGEQTTIEHNVEAMMYSMMLMQYIRETRMTLEGVLITPEMVFEVGLSGLFHDVGKAITPNKILNHPGVFSEEQRKLMELHTLHGYLLLSQNERIDTLQAQGAGKHHLSPNGGGYGIEKTFETKTRDLIQEEQYSIDNLKVGEIYSALTQPRPYNQLWESVISDKTTRARGRGDTLIIMNQMEKSRSLQSDFYAAFHEMMTNPERTSVISADELPPLFPAKSVMHLDKRDLKGRDGEMLLPYQKLHLDQDGDYALVMKEDSNEGVATCDILDMRKNGNYQDRRIASDKKVDFTPLLGFPQ